MKSLRLRLCKIRTKVYRLGVFAWQIGHEKNHLHSPIGNIIQKCFIYPWISYDVQLLGTLKFGNFDWEALDSQHIDCNLKQWYYKSVNTINFYKCLINNWNIYPWFHGNHRIWVSHKFHRVCQVATIQHRKSISSVHKVLMLWLHDTTSKFIFFLFFSFLFFFYLHSNRTQTPINLDGTNAVALLLPNNLLLSTIAHYKTWDDFIHVMLFIIQTHPNWKSATTHFINGQK